MTKDDLKKRLDGYVRVGKLISCGIALYYMLELGFALMQAVRGALGPAGLLPLVLQAALGLAVIILSMVLLFRLGKTAQPFTRENVRTLRWIAVLLIVFEPLSTLIVRLSERLSSPLLPDGIVVQAHSSLGLVLIAVGFAVSAISYVFEYGVALQQLDDETL